MSPNESSVQGKYLQISRSYRLGHNIMAMSLPDPSSLCTCSSDDLGLHIPVCPPSRVKQLRVSAQCSTWTKNCSPTRAYFSLCIQASGKVCKVGSTDGGEESKAYSAGAPTQASNATRGMVGWQVLAFIAHPYQDTGVRTFCITYTELCNP